MNDRRITFFHSPNTRSSGVLALLEELQADYALQVLNMKAGEQRKAPYTAVNPMGKVPAILHGDALVTEQSAVYLYLGDLYADRGITPQMGDPLRGPLLRWLAFYGSSFEPALVDRAMKREGGAPSMCPYGSWDTMFGTLTSQLAKGPYLLGDRFTVADVLWGGALNWTTKFGIAPKTPEIEAYVQRVTSRPSFVHAAAKDAELVAAQAASA
jgi:glutathione S-transferase